MHSPIMYSGMSIPGVPGALVREVASLPETLDGATRVGPYSVARPGALLRVVPGVARFLALEGREIQLLREPGADPVQVEQFLFGAVRSALILQRGGLPLHAACLLPPHADFAVAVAGPTGAGKSTLTAELLRRGWSLLSDDLTALYGEEDAAGTIRAWPGRPGLKLWKDACLRLGQDTGHLQPLPGDRDKYIVPANVHGQPAPLRAILALDRTLSGGLVPVEGPDRLTLLRTNTYRPRYIEPLGCVRAHFQISCRIAEQVSLLRLQHQGDADNCAALVEYHFGVIRR